ncbi:hypothetical protein AAMO2058_000812000 [Amorphochlora amoebiformis]
MSVLVERLDGVQTLVKIDGKQLARCCEICIHCFKNAEVDKKVYSKAAREIGMATSEVINAVDSLSGVFIACCKKKMTQTAFGVFTESLQLPKDHVSTLYKHYSTNIETIRSGLSEVSKRPPHYKNLNWRLELEMSSRSIHHNIKPSFLLELQTQDGSECKSELLECEYSVMKNITSQLEIALKEIDSSHCRRMSNYIN